MWNGKIKLGDWGLFADEFEDKSGMRKNGIQEAVV